MERTGNDRKLKHTGHIFLKLKPTRLFFQIEEPTIERADMNDNSRHSPKQHRHQCEILKTSPKKQHPQKSSPELSALVSTRNLPAGVKLSMGENCAF